MALTDSFNHPIDHETEVSETEVDKISTESIEAESTPCLNDIMESTLKQRQSDTVSTSPRYPYPVIGTLVSCHSHHQATVRFNLDNQDYEYEAITTTPLKPSFDGESCLLSFNHGNLKQPIITGIIQSEATDPALAPLELSSNVGIHLHCGASRIEMDENGTINIQGMHINSQAYGPHRIKGGSVKIN